MKKAKKLIPLAILLALLASCADVSSTIDTGSEGTMSSEPSVSDSMDDQGPTEQSENTENELSSRLEELSAGFDIDISVYGESYGRLALEDDGVMVELAGDDPVYYIPEEGDNGETYVANAHLNLANEIETKVYTNTWDSMWTNVFSLLAEDDFHNLSAGVYTAYIDETSVIASLAITQLSLNAAEDALEIILVFEEGNVTRIELVSEEDSIIATVNALGEDVDATLKPYAGESLDEIDDILAKLGNGNFTVTEEYLMIGNSGDYEVNDEYTSFIQVNGKYALDSGGNGYVQYDEGVYALMPYVYTDGNGADQTAWYVGIDFYGDTMPDVAGSCNISSSLFEAGRKEGTYVLRDVSGLVADIVSYDPFMSSYELSSITVTIGEESIQLTSVLYFGLEIRVTYSDIGTTDVSDILNDGSEISMINMGDYYGDVYEAASAGYDFGTSLGTDDVNLWQYAFGCIDLPYYGFGGISTFSIGVDSFVTIETYSQYMLSIGILYDGNGWYYFEEYMLNHGYEETTVKPGDGYAYNVFTTSFEYPDWVTDENGDYVDADNDGNYDYDGYEKHTVSVVDSGFYTTADDGTGYYIYLIKIDFMTSDNV